MDGPNNPSPRSEYLQQRLELFAYLAERGVDERSGSTNSSETTRTAAGCPLCACTRHAKSHVLLSWLRRYVGPCTECPIATHSSRTGIRPA